MSTTQTVRWGILGTARIADKVAPAIVAAAGSELRSVASRSAERAAFWADQHGIQRSYGDYQSLLDDDAVDAVYVPLPPSMHAEWTIRCAKAGKHVLCEKPIAVSATQAEEMAAACRENNVQLMDATMWVHHPRSADMRERIDAGSLGELRRVTIGLGLPIESYLVQKPPYAARDPQTGQASHERIQSQEHRFQRSLGGGVLLDTGWYGIGVAMWAFGSTPRRVFATARYQHGVEFSVSALMWFDGDRMASFDCAYDLAARKWFELAGSEGLLRCDDFLSPWDSKRPRYWICDQFGNASEHESESSSQEQCMIETFCRIVRSGRLENCWPDSSIANQRVCDALVKSAKNGHVVAVGEA